MKIQVSRLSPHQNGKVFGILMAIATLVFAVPMFLIFLGMPPGVDAPPAWLVLLFPLVYLVMGYIMVAIGCWFYNLMFKYIGGIEYETRDQ
ncbi:MAG TPA: hypothetical protein VGP71_01520 [Burkholderiales bacterium]|jgi:hypothetical protein|nr:hypothetical protein [Burkholderiales bacterium]